jgi:hypothetical protein
MGILNPNATEQGFKHRKKIWFRAARSSEPVEDQIDQQRVHTTASSIFVEAVTRLLWRNRGDFGPPRLT